MKNPKITIWSPYPHNTAPSQRFRYELFLKNTEFEVIYLTYYPPSSWKNLYNIGIATQLFLVMQGGLRRMIHIVQSISADFVIIHREATPIGPPVFEWILIKGMRKKVIYDFDDAIWQTDANESSVSKILRWRSKVKWICKNSWKITAGNQYLADFASTYNSHVILIPTVVDTCYFRPFPHIHREHVVIGWTGTHSTLKYLESIIPVLSAIQQNTPILLNIIANQDPGYLDVKYKFISWTEENEVNDLQDIDIGLMPLPDDEWTKGKCGFKIIQYGSVSVPVIASPVGVNSAIIQHGYNGYLASTQGEWKECLLSLISDASLRRYIGQNLRKTIENQYSVQANQTEFLKLFARKA